MPEVALGGRAVPEAGKLEEDGAFEKRQIDVHVICRDQPLLLRVAFRVLAADPAVDAFLNFQLFLRRSHAVTRRVDQRRFPLPGLVEKLLLRRFVRDARAGRKPTAFPDVLSQRIRHESTAEMCRISRTAVGREEKRFTCGRGSGRPFMAENLFDVGLQITDSVEVDASDRCGAVEQGLEVEGNLVGPACDQDVMRTFLSVQLQAKVVLLHPVVPVLLGFAVEYQRRCFPHATVFG